MGWRPHRPGEGGSGEVAGRERPHYFREQGRVGRNRGTKHRDAVPIVQGQGGSGQEGGGSRKRSRKREEVARSGREGVAEHEEPDGGADGSRRKNLPRTRGEIPQPPQPFRAGSPG